MGSKSIWSAHVQCKQTIESSVYTAHSSKHSTVDACMPSWSVVMRPWQTQTSKQNLVRPPQQKTALKLSNSSRIRLLGVCSISSPTDKAALARGNAAATADSETRRIVCSNLYISYTRWNAQHASGISEANNSTKSRLAKYKNRLGIM